MYWSSGWHMGWMILWWILALALIAGVVWLIVGLSSRRGSAENGSEEVLRQRYARGDIDRETFDRMLTDLRR